MASKQAVHHRALIEQAATKSIWLRFALLGGLLVGFGLRLFRLGSESLWYDETVSAYLARLPLAEMIAHTAGDIHPPGYYALLHAWQSLSHPTLEHGLEFLYAWPSLWAGVLVLALLVPIGRRLLGERAAVLAVWLAAVNPFHLWYGQEVRMYTIGAALGLLCLWATLRFFDQESRAWGWLIVYVAAAASGLYTLYYFAFALIALNAAGVHPSAQAEARAANPRPVRLDWRASGRAAPLATVASHLPAPGDRPACAALACALVDNPGLPCLPRRDAGRTGHRSDAARRAHVALCSGCVLALGIFLWSVVREQENGIRRVRAARC